MAENPQTPAADEPPRPTRTNLLAALQERAKELNCLYEVDKLLKSDLSLADVLQGVVEVVPPGWQYPDVCEAEIRYGSRVHRSADFQPTEWFLRSPIVVQDEEVGELRVYYTAERPREDVGPFLKEEVRLITSITDRLGHFVMFQRIKEARRDWRERQHEEPDGAREWRAAINMMEATDRNLYLRIARKMLNLLCRIGIPEAQALLQEADEAGTPEAEAEVEANVPGQRRQLDHEVLLSGRPFELAARHLSDEDILARVQKWMQEDKASFFIKVLNNPRSSLPEIADALRRYHHVVTDVSYLPLSTLRSTRVSLTQRFLTEQLDFARIAKEYVRVQDFVDLLDRIIMPGDSHGKLGGKGAGLLLARWILEQDRDPAHPVGEIKVPRTWYVVSDAILDFVAYNDLQDVIQQKFKEIDEIRREYPNIVQLFKNSQFPAEVVKGLSVALDDLGDCPVIVRSSSLLEDRLGTAFSGKYKSLFLANQGSKQERLEALLDGIAEIYASVFGPDPIEYRRERGLLEFHEEMGILIQQVVGARAGKYWLPAFAGVAFSRNEFRWSPRITREDGLIRLVPGLGTRAVDRVSDDYPALVVPGKPNLRVNVQLDEVVRYAPKMIDVINLETNTLETVSLSRLLREVGSDYPALEQVFSLLGDGMLKKPVRIMFDPERDEAVATFEGLVRESPFVDRVGEVLRTLERNLGTPVDIEFAHDGRDFYLLQCRPQSSEQDEAPAPIPKDVPSADIVFSAGRHVSNGWVPDITHVVYVDPAAYAELPGRSEMLAVGRAVGRLNKLLPKRQFVLMGPGRWGSRGDIKLGVSVTYADISNTAMLIEIARQRGNYVPDLSFGTHFFQDLVESRIRYLPLYPDEPGVCFNERFLAGSPNLLGRMLPEYAHLDRVLRVIDVPATTDGRILRVLLNADLDEALGLLAAPAGRTERPLTAGVGPRGQPAEFWRWRVRMAENIAADLDPARFGVVALYLIGSAKNATAGPGSDIDLLVHFRGTDEQRQSLRDWLEGWSLCLAEMNFLRTGYRSDGLLDVHLVTDEDLAAGNSYAVKIGAVTDPARELPLGGGRRED